MGKPFKHYCPLFVLIRSSSGKEKYIPCWVKPILLTKNFPGRYKPMKQPNKWETFLLRLNVRPGFRKHGCNIETRHISRHNKILRISTKRPLSPNMENKHCFGVLMLII